MGTHQNRSKTYNLILFSFGLSISLGVYLFLECGNTIQPDAPLPSKVHRPQVQITQAKTYPKKELQTPQPTEPSQPIQTPRQKWNTDNDGTPSFVVSLTESDSALFFGRFS